MNMPPLANLVFYCSFHFHSVSCLDVHICFQISTAYIGAVLVIPILSSCIEFLILQVVFIYGNFISSLDARIPQVSEKGVLQILLDLQFTVDILSGAKDLSSSGTDSNLKEEPTKNMLLKPSYRRKPAHIHTNSAREERVMSLIHTLSQRLDPIDWAT